MRIRPSLVPVVLALLVASSCGGDEKPSRASPSPVAGPTVTAPAVAAATPAPVGPAPGLTMSSFKFSPNVLKARAGASLTFTARNAADVVHNFTIEQSLSGKVGVDVQPGETRGIGFVVAAKPGRYAFYCRFHRGRGMTGTLVLS